LRRAQQVASQSPDVLLDRGPAGQGPAVLAGRAVRPGRPLGHGTPPAGRKQGGDAGRPGEATVSNNATPNFPGPAGPLVTPRPWALRSLSESTWRRLTRHALPPKPLDLPGRPRWRIADVLAWLQQLPTRGPQDSAEGQPCQS